MEIEDKILESNFATKEVSKVQDYLMLFKFRLSITVVFSALMAYLLAAKGSVSPVELLILGFGGFFVTAAANTFNQILEKDFDLLMKRTYNRPLPQNRMTIVHAWIVGGVLSVLGIGLLGYFNTLTAMIGALSLMSYAFIYTPLKRVTPLAVMVGAIPGALPVTIGCVAVDGYVSSMAIALFTVQFLWQFPHFWAIAWVGHEDYSKAGFKLLPTKNNEKTKEVGMKAFVYTLVLIPVFVSMWIKFEFSWVTLLALVMSTLVYAYYGFELYRGEKMKNAKQLMFASFFYLPIVLIILVIA